MRYGPIVSGLIRLEDHNRVADGDAVERREGGPADRLAVEAGAEAAAEVGQHVAAGLPGDPEVLLAGVRIGEGQGAGAGAPDGDRRASERQRPAALGAFEHVQPGRGW